MTFSAFAICVTRVSKDFLTIFEKTLLYFRSESAVLHKEILVVFKFVLLKNTPVYDNIKSLGSINGGSYERQRNAHGGEGFCGILER